MNDYTNEISVIGSLLISPEVFDTITATLTLSDFESDKCKAAFRAAMQLNDNGDPIDIATVSELMNKAGIKNSAAWLLECMEITTTAANIEAYCRLTKQDANRRRLNDIAEQISTGVFSYDDWQDIASKVSEQIEDLKDSANSDLVSSADMASEWSSYYDKVSVNPEFAFCRTGYKTLDNKYGGGMFKKGMYIIGARPGMGKTTLGVSIAENIAGANSEVLMVSIEMSRTQIMAKRLARKTGINYTKLMAGGLTSAERETAQYALEELSARPFKLIDKSKMTVVDIGRAARQIKGLKAIVIDYLGLLSPEKESANKPRYEEMTDISADIKALAKVLNVPIVVLCQLNRENTSSGDKRPQLQHLRDTGAIEQDADAVTLLHRPEYYVDKSAPDYQAPEYERIELIVAKNRHGEVGTVEMVWHGKTGNISELDFRDQNTSGKYAEIKGEQDELPF